MKYIVLLCDGMADRPLAQLNNKTPLESANTPNMDMLAVKGTIGMVKSVPDGLAPGSDVANLSVLGYDPQKFYTGRSPLEAASIGVDLSDTDVSFRCNLVTLSDEENYQDKSMIDYSAGEISTEEARILIKDINEHFKTKELSFHSGVSYRHLLLWHDLKETISLTPPHDISGQKIKEYLPDNNTIYNMMEESFAFLQNHPVNQERIRRGKRPANSIWIWGMGKKPALTPFSDKYGIKGAVISAVDLIKGIGIISKMDSIDVPGATGTVHTNFKGKADAAIDAFRRGTDFVYMHMEAPYECGHQFDLPNKIKSIELIDEKVIGPIFHYLNQTHEPFKMLVTPDHPTPVSLGTHTGEPVPFVIYDSRNVRHCNQKYSEKFARENGIYIEKGYTLMDHFIRE